MVEDAQVRRGFYATVPFEADPASSPVDPYLVAAKLTTDAVLTYHTALEFHGRAYSVYSKFYFVSKTKSAPLHFQSHEFRRALVPHPLPAKGKKMFGIDIHDHSG